MVRKQLMVIILVIAMALCTIVSAQQQANIGSVQQNSPIETKLQQQNKQLKQQQQSAITFHQGNHQSTHIAVNEIQYGYLPQINEDYNIVHTAIYPKKQQENAKFVATVPKDNFVNKLKENTEGEITNKEQSKQVQEQKAHDILKTQSVEQQKKIQEKDQNNNPDQKQSIAIPSQQPQPKPQQDLFAINSKQNYPNIDQTQQQIKFKQHLFAQPYKIKNYPFEEGQKKQSEKVEKKVQEKINKIEETQQKVQEKPTQTKVQPETKSKVQTKKQQQAQVQKPNLQTQKKSQKKQQQKSKQTQKPKQSVTQVKKQEPSTISFNIDQQYKKLTKMLSIDKEQLRSYLEYENKVQDEISDRNWKYLLAKVLMCIVIVISLYQAMCSSEGRLSKAEKEKYAPVETEMFDSTGHLETAELEQRR